MARQPSIPAGDYANILKLLADQGYRLDKLEIGPHGPIAAGRPAD